MFQIYVGISGQGRLLRALVDEAFQTQIFRVAGVFYTRMDPILEDYLKKYDIPHIRFDPLTIAEFVQSADLICLAGFIKKFPHLSGAKVINIHPSLLPKHGGQGMYKKAVHESVLRSGDQQTGVTIHWVSENYDEGEVIVQQVVEVCEGDTADTLAARVFAVEQKLYPKVVVSLLTKEFKHLDE